MENLKFTKLRLLHIIAQQENGLDSYDLNYIYYCRNYKYSFCSNNYLYDFLKKSVKLLHIPKTSVIYDIIKSYKFIFDIGAGHTEFRKKFKEINPDSTTILIDKRLSLIEGSTLSDISQDVFSYVDSLEEPLPHGSLFFISDFLHCKKDNISLLRHPNLINTDFLIRENIYDTYLEERLKYFDGGLIVPQTILSMFPTHSIYISQNFDKDHYWIYIYNMCKPNTFVTTLK